MAYRSWQRYRNDRKTGEGGGVALYIKNTLNRKLRSDLSKSNVEAVFVEVTVNDTSFIVSAAYRQPSADTEYFNNLVDCIESIIDKHELVLLGDLNFSEYDWNEPLANSRIKYIEQVCNMRQLITKPTRVTDCRPLVLKVGSGDLSGFQGGPQQKGE